MNDLATRLRTLADRLDALDLTSYVAIDLPHEMVLQRIEDVEATVVYLFGNPDGEMPKGTVKASA